MLCAVQTQQPCAPTGRDVTALTLPTILTTRRALWHTAPRNSSLSSRGVLPCLHLTLKQKLSIDTSCGKGKQQINPKGLGRKAHVTINCCINYLSKYKTYLHWELLRSNSAL